MQQGSTTCRVQLDAASFLLASATLSMEEIGALTVLAVSCSNPEGLPCNEGGVPITRLVGECLERVWPNIQQFFVRVGNRLLPDPRCPCRSAEAMRGKPKAKPAAGQAWQGLVPGRLGAAWAEWIQFRRDVKRKPVSQFCGDKQLKMLRTLGADSVQIAALEQSMTNGWEGLFSPKEDLFRKPTPTPAHVPKVVVADPEFRARWLRVHGQPRVHAVQPAHA